jgi:lipopolysaccharide/colanic/teichoic acid biosynthesis glycosyltransferase
VKLGDRGPVLFRQQRVGLDGATFDVLKFRTMRVDAEEQLAKLEAANERNGPLFKMERDPRVTRVGRFLRETSFDELPQLVNVLRGEMSLVGPRPALPSEVERFEPELRQREQVPPGITGLWQVEARDNPSFEAYRRLDLFYVENWSITLDLRIKLGTVEHLLVRLVSSFRRRPEPTTAATDGLDGPTIESAA